MKPFLFFMIIWVVASLLGIFFVPPFVEDIALTTIIVYSVAISWVIAFVITILQYISQFGNRGASYPGGPASYVLADDAAVKGFLRFSPDYLLFIPHDYENLKKDIEIKYKDINTVSFGGGTKDLQVEPKKGKKEIFLVSNRSKWKRYLDIKIKKNAAAKKAS